MNTDSTRANAQRKALVNDLHRPQYHFLPPANWMNDPNGLIQWKGQYHLFYQYNPYGPVHQRMHWGHAVSSDLVHWADLPIALTPTVGRADALGCWSGCAVDNHGVPTLVYTGFLLHQVVCLATSADDLLTWQPYTGNPVIKAPPDASLAGRDGHFRDPFVWREGDFWYLLMGSNIEGVRGTLLLYRSVDLTHWDYLHPLLSGDTPLVQSLRTGSMWECPNFLIFGDERVVIFSVQDAKGELMYPLYVSGLFQDEHFFPQMQGMVAYGGYFYAPQAMHDEQGRTLMWGWLREGRSASLIQEAGWAGVMSLPVIVELSQDGVLKLEPAAELKMLREKHWRYEAIELSATETFLHSESQNDCLEILAEFVLSQDCEFGLRVCYASDGREQTSIVYQSALHQVSVEREQSSIYADVDREDSSMVIEADEVLKLHVFLDRSVLEVFVNGRYYLASRVYPKHRDSIALELFTREGDVLVRLLDIWHMASIWNR